MSEKQEHRRRYLARLQWIAEFNKWLDREPARLFLWRWHRWKKQRPARPEF